MKQRDINPVPVRFPPDLKVALRRAATQNERSLNRQVLQYVQQGLRIDGVVIRKRAPKKNAPPAVTGGASSV